MVVADNALDGEEGAGALVHVACLAWSALPHGDGITEMLFGSGTRGKYGSTTAALIGDDAGSCGDNAMIATVACGINAMYLQLLKMCRNFSANSAVSETVEAGVLTSL